jgi:hypothetical protein
MQYIFLSHLMCINLHSALIWSEGSGQNARLVKGNPVTGAKEEVASSQLLRDTDSQFTSLPDQVYCFNVYF